MSRFSKAAKLSVGASVIALAAAVGAWLALRGGAGPFEGQFEHDFGVIARDPNEMVELNHMFKLTNTSDEPVRVLMARPDCSCISARQGLPATVMPGKTLELPIVMRLEAVNKVVNIYLELFDESQQKLQVRAKSKFKTQVQFWEPHIALTPGKAVDHPFSIEHYEAGTPPLPELQAPDGFVCRFDEVGWRSIQPSEWLGVRPSVWRGILHIEPPANPWADGAAIAIQIGDSKRAVIPLVVADDSATTQPAATQPENSPARVPDVR